jgi:hypothetical protein
MMQCLCKFHSLWRSENETFGILHQYQNLLILSIETSLALLQSSLYFHLTTSNSIPQLNQPNL